MRKKVGAFPNVLLLFAVTAMLVGSLLSFIPTRIREWLGYIIIPVAVLLYSWFSWHHKRREDQNELDCLEEVVQEHERGIRDNSKTIKEQISIIEREHKHTPELAKRLERARHALHK
jgi:hypothetical protein